MRTLILCALLLTQSDSEIQDVPLEYWIVVSPATKLMAGDVSKGTLSPGTLLRCSKTHGRWKFSVEYRGWVHSNDLVALDKAIDYFSGIISQRPTAAAFHHRGIAQAALNRWDAALADFNEAAQRGDKSSELLINVGNAQRHLGNISQAIESYTAALKTNPKATYALLHRGSLLGEMGHWEASLKDLKDAAELAPNSSEVQNHLGVSLRMLGRFEEAIAAYSRAIEIVPNHALAIGNRGYAMKCLGHYAEALADYEESLKYDPDSLEVKNDLAWLLATCPRAEIRNPERAVQLASDVVSAVERRNADYLDTLAAAQASAQDFESAQKAIEEALQMIGGKTGSDEIGKRMQLYKEHKPYVEPPPES